MLKNKKIKSFWKDTEAISPIIATILVLDVAAGVGLYFWFDTFQVSAQEQVGSSTDSQFDVLRSSTTPMITTMETTIDVPYASAYHDYYKHDDPYITFTGYKPEKYQTGISFNDSDASICWVLEDERFMLEVPVQIKANANLHNVKVKVDIDNREILEGGGSWGKLDFSPYCIHLDRGNGYALQYYDSASSSWKEFKGELHPNSDAITFDDEKYIYKFDGGKPTLNLSDFITPTAAVDLSHLGTAETDDGIYNETNLDAVTYPDRQTNLGRYYKDDSGVFMFNGKIITAEGKERYARKVSAVDGAETPWLTASTFINSWGASNSDTQDAYLISNTYPIGDLKTGEVKTAYVYVYVNWAKFNADTGKVVATVPFEFSSADGFSSSETVTFKLYESGVS